jgi:predicted amidohydrolase
MITVASAQLSLSVGDVAANRAAGLAAIEEAAAGGASLVVLPELSDTGYVLRSRKEAASLADHERTLEAWSAASSRSGVVVVGGLCVAVGDGTLRNAAALVDPTGVRALYWKAHLWGAEPDLFAAGDDAPPVVDTVAGRVGLVVCYDLEFPEWVRKTAEAGAEILAAPVNWPKLADPPAGERPPEVVKAQADAATNGLWIVVADRCGPERGVHWVGGSVIVDPDGYPVAGPAVGGERTLLLAEIDPRRARDKSLGPRNDRFRDRRPELY